MPNLHGFRACDVLDEAGFAKASLTHQGDNHVVIASVRVAFVNYLLLVPPEGR